MHWTDRILDDGTDNERWLGAHRDLVTASRAQSFAKLASVDKYLAAMLAPRTFYGNEYTKQGHRWEPMMLGWAGIPQNLALVHSPDEPGIAATVDGIKELPLGALRLAEAKVKHQKIIDGPSVGEWRQVAIQMFCFPEALELEWIWVELDKDGDIRAGRHGEPCSITIRRDHPKLIAATAQVLPIARELVPRLRAALEFEKELLAI